jgi:hypothetical protein
MGKEVKLHRAPANDCIVTMTMNLALKTQTPEKGQRVTQGTAWQNWNCYFVLLHGASDVKCRLKLKPFRAGMEARIQTETLSAFG